MFTTPIEEDLRTATQLHSAGRLQEAEAIYRRVLESVPQQPDALHLLGVIAMQIGQPKLAEGLIRNAIQVNPNFPDALSNLGRLLTDQQRYAEAAAAYRQTTKLRPLDAGAWYVLATALRLAERYLEALEAAAQARRLNPQIREVLLEIGNIHRLMKNPTQAVLAFRQAIAMQPMVADGHNLLGNTLADLEQFDDAIAAYQRAIGLEPGNAKYHFNLGTALSRAGKRQQALVQLDAAVELDPNDAMAHSARGTALSRLHRNEEALTAHMRAVQLSPDTALFHYAIGECYRVVGDNNQAETAFARALKFDSNLAEVWLRLGEVHMTLGKFDAATQEFTRALELDPVSTLNYTHLSSIGKLKSEVEVNRMRSLLDDSKLSLKEQAAVGFAVGKLLDEREEFDEAFQRYERANRLFLEQVISEASRFDREELVRTVDEHIETFTTDFFKARKDWGLQTELPVFVVGMPRSGTSLVEQIAASHWAVFGSGERPEIRYIASQAGAPAEWTDEKLKLFASGYVERQTRLSPGATRIVDKMPANIMNLGLIATVFPKAKIVVCKRDAIDNCLSCYFQFFARENLAFSYDLLDCAKQSVEQDRLLTHWQKVLPNPMMIMQYEELVVDQGTQSRRLIDFLGLPWDPACLEFYNTERAVVTASVWQVRQPMYKRSVGRWRHYEKHLDPLIKALNL